MEKMRCPNCKEWIYSKLLGHSDSILCENCNTTVPSKDVCIYSKGIKIFKADLIANIGKYQKLLIEAKRDLQLLMDRTEEDNTLRVVNIKQVISSFEELLEASRDHFRSNPESMTVEYRLAGEGGAARLINLSMGGMCIEPASTISSPFQKDKIRSRFILPTLGRPMLVEGVVSWVKGGGTSPLTIGIKFMNLDETNKSEIWRFISKTA